MAFMRMHPPCTNYWIASRLTALTFKYSSKRTALFFPHFRTFSSHARIEQLAAEKKLKEESFPVQHEASLPHPIWSDYQVHDITVSHRKPQCLSDWLAYGTVQLMRFNFDVLTGYKFGKLTEEKWMTRAMFLETVAGVPGSAASVQRHLASLRLMKADHGWIHTLLEEAENERMHLMTFIELKNPGLFMRLMVLLAQGVFFNFYFFAYLVSPSFCHRMVGYLEEEAVVTYTKLIAQIDEGTLPKFEGPAPKIARDYWLLSEDSNLRDVFLAIRADEAHHRNVNHNLASLNSDDTNPYQPGQ